MLGVNMNGIHLFKLNNEPFPLKSYLFKCIASFSPSDDYLMIVIQEAQQTTAKYIFKTTQVGVIF